MDTDAETKRIDELIKDIRAVQIQLAEINVGVQRDVKYIRESLQTLKETQCSIAPSISALALCSASIAALTVDSIKSKENIDSIKTKVEKHDTYFAVFIGAIVLLCTWVSGLLTSLFSGK
jgi:hypothetical protein